MITLLAFVVTLGILILVHEYGHYRVALGCGVKVDRFSIGFGRVLWRRQPTQGGTEFVISALPLGGYVRWIDDREEGVLPSEANQTFKSKSLAQRTAIVAAGPLSNLLLAVVLYAASNWIGVEEPRALLATPPAGSLAEQAGLRAGDEVHATSSDGTDWHDVRSMSDLSWEVAQAVERLFANLDGDPHRGTFRIFAGQPERPRPPTERQSRPITPRSTATCRARGSRPRRPADAWP